MKNLTTTRRIPKFLRKPYKLVALFLTTLIVSTGCNFQKVAQNRFSKSYHLAQKIAEIQIDSNDKNENWNSKNYLMFMLLNPRMNFVDLAILQKKQILNAKYKDGRLVSGTLIFINSKNGFNIMSDLNSQSIDILNMYHVEEALAEDCIFPIGFDNSKEGRKEYNKNRQFYHKKFNQFAQEVNWDVKFRFESIKENWSIASGVIQYPAISTLSEK